MTLRVEWIDGLREPRNAPNPAYPNGIDLDMSIGSTRPSCFTELPYPTKRCGSFIIRCDVCGLIVGVSTAGRADDPRSLKVNCKTREL